MDLIRRVETLQAHGKQLEGLETEIENGFVKLCSVRHECGPYGAMEALGRAIASTQGVDVERHGDAHFRFASMVRTHDELDDAVRRISAVRSNYAVDMRKLAKRLHSE